MRCTQLPTKNISIGTVECTVERYEFYTYVDQEGIHLRRVSLHPTVWIEAIAICAEQVRVSMNDPRIEAENSLETALISTSNLLDAHK